MYSTQIVNVLDSSSVGEARRIAVKVAEVLGLDETIRGRIAIVVTELASNLFKHAGGGDIIILAKSFVTHKVLEVLSVDQGRGMTSVSSCLVDGYSTSGTAGGGLGAISRLPDLFDIYSLPGRGTVVLASFMLGKEPEAKGLEVGGLNFPYPGELVSGDSWGFFDSAEFSTFIVADGLGHGPDAHAASRLAVEVFKSHVALPPQEILEKIHNALARTRGAAIGVARIDASTHELTFSGLGNITGLLIQTEKIQGLMSLDGIVGHNARRFHSLKFPWSRDSILTLQSDGLTSRCRLDAEVYPGLVARHPTLIAAVLMRDGRRGRDDATIVVCKAPRIMTTSW